MMQEIKVNYSRSKDSMDHCSKKKIKGMVKSVLSLVFFCFFFFTSFREVS